MHHAAAAPIGGTHEMLQRSAGTQPILAGPGASVSILVWNSAVRLFLADERESVIVACRQCVIVRGPVVEHCDPGGAIRETVLDNHDPVAVASAAVSHSTALHGEGWRIRKGQKTHPVLFCNRAFDHLLALNLSQT